METLDLTPYIVPDSMKFTGYKATERDYLLWRVNQQWSGKSLTPPDYVGVRDYGYPRPPKEARFL